MSGDELWLERQEIVKGLMADGEGGERPRQRVNGRLAAPAGLQPERMLHNLYFVINSKVC
jgi:hypothetical protein